MVRGTLSKLGAQKKRICREPNIVLMQPSVIFAIGEPQNRENVMAASNVPTCADEKLFRTVKALGAELRRQGVWSFAGKTNIDLTDLAYAAIAVSAGPDRSDQTIAVGELTRTVAMASPNSVNSA
jgi:hypothetical protein